MSSERINPTTRAVAKAMQGQSARLAELEGQLAATAWPNFTAPPMYDNPAEGWIDPRLPDFQAIWSAARKLGYAVGLHGSMKRDCDLIAVPWTDEAADCQTLIDAICEALKGQVIGVSSHKPHGRFAVNIQVPGYVKLLDLSVTPRAIEREGQIDKQLSEARAEIERLNKVNDFAEKYRKEFVAIAGMQSPDSHWGDICVVLDAKLNKLKQQLAEKEREIQDDIINFGIARCDLELKIEGLEQQLAAAAEREKGLRACIEPGTQAAFSKALFDIAEECGMLPVSSESPTSFIREKLAAAEKRFEWMYANEFRLRRSRGIDFHCGYAVQCLNGSESLFQTEWCDSPIEAIDAAMNADAAIAAQRGEGT
ncbi:hypothetical protein [Planctomicrobium piriforme]|uniref:Uncharacterized protein n=1 Tax=Planctomicrobium piriforme TaxID=1576369 RepID=A0A1I3EGU5_9PLAN|nr:hypothetical protein [Planctomicrobium piriforme]SFH97951.1 hypothetical protein SAMN05421753_104208 [Planctomicrobium piriforme]